MVEKREKGRKKDEKESQKQKEEYITKIDLKTYYIIIIYILYNNGQLGTLG